MLSRTRLLERMARSDDPALASEARKDLDRLASASRSSLGLVRTRDSRSSAWR